MAGENWVDVGSVEEVSATPLKRLSVKGRDLAISFRDGQFGAVSNTCNHVGDGGRVAQVDGNGKGARKLGCQLVDGHGGDDG